MVVVSTLVPSWTQIGRALVCIALTTLLSIPIRALRRKLRIAKGLAPLPGPKGAFLLGNIPTFIKHKNRIYDFLVRAPRSLRMSSKPLACVRSCWTDAVFVIV